jgi:hypothetical protein
MLVSEDVTVFYQCPPEILSSVLLSHPVMQMNLDLAKSSVLHLSHSFQQATIVLFDGIKVSVSKRSSVVVTNSLPNGSCLPDPVIEPSHLSFPIQLDAQSPLLIGPFVVSGLEMVRHYKDYMTTAVTVPQSTNHLISTPKRVSD